MTMSYEEPDDLLAEVKDLFADETVVLEALGTDTWDFANHNCHGASLSLIRTGIIPGRSRIARGTAPGVGGQHSWVCVGDDCYGDEVVIVDITLWSYVAGVPHVLVAFAGDRPHVPHQAGSIWQFGRPPDPIGPVIEVAGLSEEAKFFLNMAAPNGLDRDGWRFLMHAPVEGWPSPNIITACAHDPRLRKYLPIDVHGMLTDDNPNGLYW